MRLRLTRPLIVLDTETTGTHPQVDRIVQIGLVKWYPEGRRTTWLSLINPGMPIPPEATAVHDISDADVSGQPTFSEVAPTLVSGLRGCDVAGYNVSFDLQFIREELRRMRAPDVLSGCRVVDVMRIFKQKHPRGLTDAVRQYLGSFAADSFAQKAHDALADALATADVLAAQLDDHPDLPDTVEELHRVFFESPAEGHLDSAGKIAWRYGQATLNFGKWATQTLEEVAKRDPSYLRWMMTGEFNEDTKRIINEAMAGRFPVRR